MLGVTITALFDWLMWREVAPGLWVKRFRRRPQCRRQGLTP